MKSLFLPSLFLLILGAVSCSWPASKAAEEERLTKQRIQQFQKEASRRRTRKQGKMAARRYEKETGFAITRYDLPMIRTGAWSQHFARYHHFGIKEGIEVSFGTLEFYQGWNEEMDRLLLARYGNEYRKYRKKILPRKDAKPTKVAKILLQPEEGYRER